MSSSDNDDDFFNVAQSEADYNFNEENVLIQSKAQLPPSLKFGRPSTVTKGSLHLSSSEESLVSLGDVIPEKDESTKKDSVTINDDNPVKRGRKRTRSSFRSHSSSSSPSSPSSKDASLERSRSNSLDLERKRPKRVTTAPDENDDFFKELESMTAPAMNDEITATTTTADGNGKSIEENAALTNEAAQSSDTLASRSPSIPVVHSNPKRVYKIRFLSKLEGTINKSVQVKVLGKYSFEKILPPALAGLVKAFKVPQIMKNYYDPENVSLYRNESMKLLNFMNCNSLNIPQSFENEISDVEIVLVPKDKEEEYEKEWNDKIFEEKDPVIDSTTESESNKATESKNTQFEQQFEDELKYNDNSIQTTSDINLDESETPSVDEPLMKIALLGNDNKKLYVNVRKSTPFSKLVDYYRIQKQLPQSKKIILSFDHDELDLNECVNDQDMEDEDVIDVIVK